MYLRTDEELEAIDALRMAVRFAEDVQIDAMRWKWVLIALHNGTQAIMVLALKMGDGTNVLKAHHAAKVRDAFESGKTPMADPQLDCFLNLYDKVKCLRTPSSYARSELDDELDLQRLNALRNDFIHFTPKAWAVELAGLPRICLAATALIAFLGWKSEAVRWHKSQESADAQTSVRKLAELFEKLRQGYAKQTDAL